jgi:hypothetical protein
MARAEARAPHHARFAAAIALVSSTALAGCYEAHERVDPSRPVDAARADAQESDAGPPDCRSPLPCTCATLSMPGTCDAVGLSVCCPIVGPLAPPSLD